MDQLLFKKGLLANLNDATKKAGTLYVTTDERCLYMDVLNTKTNEIDRIRLQGSVLYFETLDEFYDKVKPPYSTDVIYFIEKDNSGTQFNALMRWRPDSSKPNEGEWIQLNVTAANVEAAITNLQGQITTNANGLKAHADVIEQISKDLDTVEGYVGAPAHKDASGSDVAASGLHARMDTAESNITAITGEIGTDTTADSIKGRISAVETAIGDDSTTGSVKGRIKAVEDRTGELEEVVEDHEERIDALENDAANNPKALQSDFQELYNQVNTGNDSLVKQIEGNDADILALQQNSATKKELQDVSDALAEHVSKAATDEEVENIRGNLQGQIDAINEELGDPSTETIPAATGTVWHAIEANAEEIAAINEALGDGSGEGSITSRLSAVEGKASDNTEAIEDLATKVGIPEIPTYGDDISNLYGQVIKNKTDIANHEGRVGNLEITVGNASSGLVKQVADNVTNISTNAGNIGKNTKAINDLSQALEDHQKDAADTYATKEEVGDIEEDLNSKILAANAMRYIGTVATKAELDAKTKVSVGDTYVASADLYNSDNETIFAHAGDLIIAKGTEVNNVITADLSWDVVDTGYVRAHENKLVLEQVPDNSETTDTDETMTLIHLKNYADQEVSAFAIKSLSANLTVAAQDSVVQLDLQWAEF